MSDVISDFLERFIYVTKGDYVYDSKAPKNQAIVKFSEFNRTYSNLFVKIKNSALKKTKVTLPKAWIQHPLRSTADRIEYYPNKPFYFNLENLYCVNVYQPPVFDRNINFDNNHEECNIVFEHLHYLFPKEDELKWFISWMSFCVQHPERRSKVTPLHISPYHGTGRGWVVKLMEKLLGEHNCTKTKMSALYNSDFQNFMYRSVLCCIEEVREKNEKKFSVSDQIRDILTEDRLELNLKYGERGTQRVFTNFLLFSNHMDALAIPQEDRRINVFCCPHKPREVSYYKSLYDWLETSGVDAFYDYLMKIDISEFNWFTSLESETRDLLIENAQNITEQAFHMLIDSPPAKALTFRQVIVEVNRCLRDFGSSEFANEKQILKLLQTFCKKAAPVKIGNSKVRPWYLNKEQEIMPLNQLRSEISRLHLSPPTL